ncbi:hypothetical protein [Paraflavitalea sp. CAU 1676]|uniref:hypothetical protein n=1 Tax=Paraflavitalea sp. CAU 1676 TaxID=3032598 RepID=UPI0023D997CD|nr:hypothetical protein [Paraflavitalea sp. CAU 1676]MDF2187512.1 hypothetical protein [Paraflavitalea sp. CAU 1676]
MNRRLRIPEQLLVYTGSLIFFICTLAANFSGPHDSIGYLNGIVKGDPLFHPHHLLYHFVTHYWYVVAHAILPGIRDYYLTELFTALWGSGTITVVYCFFRRRFNMPVLESLIGITVVAFSFGPWFYSTNIEVYAPPIFFLLLALYIAAKSQLQKKDFLYMALLQILAILFHQVHVLFTPVILYKLWEQRKSVPMVPAFIQYALTGLVLVGGAYFIVGWVILDQNDTAKWMNWLEGYAQQEAHWKPLNSKTPFLVATGYSHAFIGGHFVFRLPPVERYLSTHLSNHSLGDEMYLVRNMPQSVAILLAALSLLLGALMIWLVIRFARRYKTIHATMGHVVTPLMMAGIIYSVFFTFWMPEILEFWIFQVVLVWLLLIGTLRYGGQGVPAFAGWGAVKPAAIVASMGIMLFIINFFGSIHWLMELENDQYYTKIRTVKEEVRDKDMILLQDGWQLRDFFKYFINKTAHEAPAADSLRQITDKAVSATLQQGGRIYIFTEASHYQPHGTVYIDSLLKAFEPRTKVYPEGTARIVVIE